MLPLLVASKSSLSCFKGNSCHWASKTLCQTATSHCSSGSDLLDSRMTVKGICLGCQNDSFVHCEGLYHTYFWLPGTRVSWPRGGQQYIRAKSAIWEGRTNLICFLGETSDFRISGDIRTLSKPEQICNTYLQRPKTLLNAVYHKRHTKTP